VVVAGLKQVGGQGFDERPVGGLTLTKRTRAARRRKPASTKRGPTPKLQRQLEQLQDLPRSQQRFVSQMLDTVLQQAER
jgi:hypothetical protein